MDRTSSSSPPPAPPIPPDDPRRALVIARPDDAGSLPHLSIAGGTYTVLLTGRTPPGATR